MTERSVAHAWDVVLRLKAAGTFAALALVETLLHYLPLVQQVIDQTTRRVFAGARVPASEKIVSLFEPHTAIIQRGKAHPYETEFGRKVWYCESEGGIITDYRLLAGNPPEANQWLPSLKHQCKLFGHPPEIATADRGVYSPENEQAAKDLGVKRVVLPKPGAKNRDRQRQEAQPWFKAVRRWRSGIEGRISSLRRDGHGTLAGLGRDRQQFDADRDCAHTPALLSQEMQKVTPQGVSRQELELGKFQPVHG